MATTNAMRTASTASSSETGSAWPMREVTEPPGETSEVPRLPLRAWPSQWPYWAKQRLVEPELVVDLPDGPRGGALAEDGDGRVARGEVQQHERPERDEQQDQDQVDEAT